MGDLSSQQVERALGASELTRAACVIHRARPQRKRRDIDLEEMCCSVALHQPVAGDLRLITAADENHHELERIGDRAVNICEAVHHREESIPLRPS